MKLEPLKGKMIKYHGGLHPKCSICKVEEDIKSAVEWLKNRLKTDTIINPLVETIYVLELIDKAFEDVTK